MFETSSESPAPVRVVSEALKEYIDRLGPIWIEGEISELNERSGGMAFYASARYIGRYEYLCNVLQISFSNSATTACKCSRCYPCQAIMVYQKWLR